jgi:putative DNA primase/helicase
MSAADNIFGAVGGQPPTDAPDGIGSLDAALRPTANGACEAAALAELQNGFWPTVLRPLGEVRPDGTVSEGKDPFYQDWGLRQLGRQRIKALFAENPARGLGRCVGPGKAGGKWLIAIEGDGPEAEESRLRLFAGEVVETLGHTSRRGDYAFFTVDGPRLLKALAGCKASKKEAGVFETIPTLPDLEFRVGGFSGDGKTPLQVQCAIPPTIGTDGQPRRANGIENPAPFPEAGYEYLERLAERIQEHEEIQHENENNNGDKLRASRWAVPVHDPWSPEARQRAYVEKVLKEEAEALEGLTKGKRHLGLLPISMKLASLVKSGLISESDCREKFTQALLKTGLPEGEIRSLIDSALKKANPRTNVPDFNQRPTTGGSRASKSNGDNRPEIKITTDEKTVNDQAIEALAADHDLYRLGYLLATILHEGDPPRGIEYRDGPPPQIAPIDPATLRERMAAAAQWIGTKTRKRGRVELVPAHPPMWSVHAVHKRGVWRGIRPIMAVIESPTIRRDGSILSTPGYDPATRLYYRPSIEFEPIPESPGKAEIEAARDELLDLVCDFPFRDETHKAVWLTSLLTVIARPSFEGPAPLFGCDGNCSGTGKSLLADLVAIIASGRRMPRSTWPTGMHADEELRKRITSLALAAERFTLLDNVETPLGGGPLDAALTSDTWKDRMLGSMTTTPPLPMLMIWFASGNNLQYRGDFPRRVLQCRLETSLENPEERTGFKYPDLIGHAIANRGKLVRAALIILRAHHVAGRPKFASPLGSFESWTRAVVDPVNWIIGKNPLDVRKEIKDCDHAAQLRSALIEGWEELPDHATGVTAAAALKILSDDAEQAKEKKTGLSYPKLREALAELPDKGDLPSARSLGRHLSAMNGRTISQKDEDGLTIALKVLRGKQDRKSITKWKVEKITP